ncbi:hypothetical protein V1525DRAFT_390701 [Lipomyces kononenkoae]|uniref:Uncharacterized protein n=1 Tax=Lipomyces kononenkoae TaxID=34357 RepID=A0ACC3SUB8_LIPKO
MSKYAKSQPVGFIERVAIVGAGGTVGSHITKALLKTGRHTVTALSRKDSGNKLPEGVVVAPVDYDDEATIVAALKGQQFFIITTAPRHPQQARPGGRQGCDIDNIKLGEDAMLRPVAKANRDDIETLGMQWITMCCVFCHLDPRPQL